LYPLSYASVLYQGRRFAATGVTAASSMITQPCRPFNTEPPAHGPAAKSSFPAAWSGGPGDLLPLAVAVFQVALELALDPLQRVVDGLDVAIQLIGDLLVG